MDGATHSGQSSYLSVINMIPHGHARGIAGDSVKLMALAITAPLCAGACPAGAADITSRPVPWDWKR